VHTPGTFHHGIDEGKLFHAGILVLKKEQKLAVCSFLVMKTNEYNWITPS
jgi:hypothetical protein